MEVRWEDRGEEEVGPVKKEIEALQTEQGKGGGAVLVKMKAPEILEEGGELLGEKGVERREVVEEGLKGKGKAPAVTSTTRKAEA